MRRLSPIFVVVFGFVGCPDSHEGALAEPARTKTFFSCKVCLADDAARCATHAPVCGDSSERTPSQEASKDALCDTLSAAELARRPTPPGFKQSPWNKNACYAWPEDAFKATCTTVTKTCDSVPIH
jgi:hypothetical protein